MALWGKTDTLASAPKYITKKAKFPASAVNLDYDSIDLTNSSKGFAVGDGVVYNNGGGTSITGLTSGSTYYVAASGLGSGIIKLSDTEAHAKAGTNIINLTGQGNNAQFIQRNTEGNESTGATGVGDHTYNGSDIYFVDADEAKQPSNRARGIKGAGWWAYRSWTNADGSVQHRCEQLVTLGAYAGATGFGTFQAQAGDNAADDAVVYDATTTITVQPTNRTTIAPGGTNFPVTSTATGAYSALTYQWQISNDAGATWSNLSNAGVYSGVATNTLVVSNSTGLNGKKYRVICGTNTANTNATSVAVTLTVT